MLPPPINPAFFPAPPSQALGGSLLVQGEALTLVHRALMIMRRQNPSRASSHPVFDQLLRRASDAMNALEAVSPTRQHDTTFDAPEQDSLLTATIGTREAAEILGVNQRTCQRLAGDLGGARRSGRWVFHRDVIETFKVERALRRTED